MPLTKVPASMADADMATQAELDAVAATIQQNVKLSGDVVQVVTNQSGALGSSVNVIPLDDTIPQITEGTEFITASITPTNASNLLDISVVMHLANNTGVTNVAALFQDANANALCSGVCSSMGVANALTQVVMKHRMTAGTISATTFRVRVGPSGAVTMTVNGSAGARLMGGVLISSITITEIKA